LNHASLIVKLLIKGGISAIFLGFALLGSVRMIWLGLAGIFHLRVWNNAPDQTLGGGDVIGFLALIGLISAIGLAALRGARATWNELREPETAPPNYSPGSRWASASDLVDASAPEFHVEGAGKIVKARPTLARVLIWIGHGLMILSVLGIFLSFTAGGEAAPMGIGMAFAIIFYVAGFAIGLLDE